MIGIKFYVKFSAQHHNTAGNTVSCHQQPCSSAHSDGTSWPKPGGYQRTMPDTSGKNILQSKAGGPGTLGITATMKQKPKPHPEVNLRTLTLTSDLIGCGMSTDPTRGTKL